MQLEGMTLRPIEERDLPALFEIHGRQTEQMGSPFPLPNPFHPSIFQVAVGEHHGQVIGFLFFEREVEVEMISDNPLFMRLIHANIERLEAPLRLLNFSTLRAFVPRFLGKAKIAGMANRGFSCMDDNWRCFVKTLHEPQCSRYRGLICDCRVRNTTLRRESWDAAMTK